MRKLIIVTLILATKVTVAQTYISIGTGYLFPTGNSQLKSESYDTASVKQSAKITNFSYTAGIGINLAFGYMLSKNLGIEFNMSSIIGQKYTSTIDYIDLWGATLKVNKQIGNYKAPFSLILIPSAVFKGNAVKGITPYGRIGVALLRYSKQYYDFTLISSASTAPIIYSETETTNRLSVGFSGALGVHIPINKKLKLGIECSMLSLNPYAKKSIMTKHMRNGVDNLSTMPVSKRETEYVKQFTTQPSYDQNQPDTQLAYTNNYSNVGLVVSVCYSFGK